MVQAASAVSKPAYLTKAEFSIHRLVVGYSEKLAQDQRKGFDTLVALVTWELWKERIRRTFQQQGKNQGQLIQHIKAEAVLSF